jgi:hypothetical protein
LAPRPIQAERARPSQRASLLGAVLLTLATLVGCSPEGDRTRGSAGADIGNTALPIRLHGDRSKNNPSFQTPLPGLAPRNARAVTGGG